MTAIAMDRVTKRYGEFTALDGVSLALAENRIYGLMGRNGAGKTTAMQLLTGHDVATSGTVEILGEDPFENARALARTCFVREALVYPDRFRVQQALDVAASALPGWDGAFADRLVEDFALSRDQVCARLSRGQRSALGVVIGLASRAPLTFFDEPTLGLDAPSRELFYDRLLGDYAEHPRTVVLSTHLIDEVSDLVEHVVVLDGGRVVIDEEADALRGRAVTVTGPANAVERFALDHVELHREQLGGYLRVTLSGVEPEPRADLQFGPVSLQQLISRATRDDAGARTAGEAA